MATNLAFIGSWKKCPGLSLEPLREAIKWAIIENHIGFLDEFLIEFRSGNNMIDFTFRGNNALKVKLLIHTLWVYIGVSGDLLMRKYFSGPSPQGALQDLET